MAYKRLLELAEDGDFDRLVNGFIEKEEKNFACFTYATELNNEMEKMQQRIKDLQVCSRLFTSPLSQLVLLGWGGFFLSHVSSITAHTRAQLTAIHRGGIRGMQRGSQKYNSNRQRVLGAKSVSMLPPCTQQKYCSIQEGQELPRPCVGWRSAACCGAITCPPGLGMVVPRGAKWGVPAPRVAGWSPTPC